MSTSFSAPCWDEAIPRLAQDVYTAANQYLAHALAVKGAGPKIRDPAVGLLCQKLGKMFWIGPGSHLDQLWGRKGGIESEAIVA